MAVHSQTSGVGAAAPPFSLPDRDGSIVSLTELIAGGPLVLVFLRGFA
jgi:peroxiredoxin